MKNNCNYVFIILFLFITAVSCKEEKSKNTTGVTRNIIAPPDFNADSAYKFVAEQVNFGPRVPNTPQHRKCGDYLIKQLERFGATTEVQAFQAKAYNGTMLDLRNIKASFYPNAKKRILLAAHWDTRPYADQDKIDTKKPILGANDGGSGVGVLLEIARVIGSNTSPTVGIDIILFDGEDYGQPEFHDGPYNPDTWCLGSQYWAKNKGNYSAYFGILLDMVGAKDAKFAMEGTSMQYAPSVVKKVWDAGNRLGYGSHFIYQQTSPITDDHAYVNTIAKIPMIDIIEYDGSHGNYFGKYWHTHNDNMDIIDRSTLNAVGHTLLYVLYNE
ncbi:MAG: M28 family peptidase [Cytophagaceae bacterium]